jgi:hypothetical protein
MPLQYLLRLHHSRVEYFVSPCPSTDTSDAVSVHNKTVNTDLSYEFARVASAIGLFLPLT